MLRLWSRQHSSVAVTPHLKGDSKFCLGYFIVQKLGNMMHLRQTFYVVTLLHQVAHSFLVSQFPRYISRWFLRSLKLSECVDFLSNISTFANRVHLLKCQVHFHLPHRLNNTDQVSLHLVLIRKVTTLACCLGQRLPCSNQSLLFEVSKFVP